ANATKTCFTTSDFNPGITFVISASTSTALALFSLFLTRAATMALRFIFSSLVKPSRLMATGSTGILDNASLQPLVLRQRRCNLTKSAGVLQSFHSVHAASSGYCFCTADSASSISGAQISSFMQRDLSLDR